MKKVLLGVCLAFFMAPAFAVETSAQGYDASQYFDNPHRDARFKYEFPSGKTLPFKKDKVQVVDDDSDITLDEADIKPVKKIIKRLDPDAEAPSVDRKDIPMNYDSFPKFYDNNNMIQQQFMPMF